MFQNIIKLREIVLLEQTGHVQNVDLLFSWEIIMIGGFVVDVDTLYLKEKGRKVVEEHDEDLRENALNQHKF